MTDDPQTLLAAYRDRSAAAAEELAERALRIALRTASAMLRDRAQAADVAQDVAVEVLRGVDRLRNSETLDAWIHRIAVRHTMRVIKKTRLRALREVSLDDLPETAQPESPEQPYESAVRRELAAAVADALEQLPAKQRMALVLRYVHDMSHQQIAEAMNIRPGTAGALITRGRTTLRDSGALSQFDAPEGSRR